MLFMTKADALGPFPVLMINDQGVHLVDFSPLNWTCSQNLDPILSIENGQLLGSIFKTQLLHLNRLIVYCYYHEFEGPGRQKCSKLDVEALTWIELDGMNYHYDKFLCRVNESTHLRISYWNFGQIEFCERLSSDGCKNIFTEMGMALP